MITGAYYLKRGDTFDPEDFRMTHRLHIARSILSGLGITPEVKHDKATHEAFNACGDKCITTWHEWVTNELFEAAFRLADEYQTKHGEYERQQAYEIKKQRSNPQ